MEQASGSDLSPPGTFSGTITELNSFTTDEETEVRPHALPSNTGHAAARAALSLPLLPELRLLHDHRQHADRRNLLRLTGLQRPAACRAPATCTGRRSS
jgi:hypothetical protein